MSPLEFCVKNNCVVSMRAKIGIMHAISSFLTINYCEKLFVFILTVIITFISSLFMVNCSSIDGI